jgi:thiol:disulfide interchange protein
VPLILRLAGVGIIVLGLTLTGLIRIPVLGRERRVDLTRIPRGPAAAFPLGLAFAFGWVPCSGPVLATVLTMASATSTVVWGALLLACYSIGLGIPFIVLALGFQRARGTMTWLRRNGRRIEIAGGTLLIAIGVLFVTDRWQPLFPAAPTILRPIRMAASLKLAASAPMDSRHSVATARHAAAQPRHGAGPLRWDRESRVSIYRRAS